MPRQELSKTACLTAHASTSGLTASTKMANGCTGSFLAGPVVSPFQMGLRMKVMGVIKHLQCVQQEGGSEICFCSNTRVCLTEIILRASREMFGAEDPRAGNYEVARWPAGYGRVRKRLLSTAGAHAGAHCGVQAHILRSLLSRFSRQAKCKPRGACNLMELTRIWHDQMCAAIKWMMTSSRHQTRPQGQERQVAEACAAARIAGCSIGGPSGIAAIVRRKPRSHPQRPEHCLRQLVRFISLPTHLQRPPFPSSHLPSQISPNPISGFSA